MDVKTIAYCVVCAMAAAWLGVMAYNQLRPRKLVPIGTTTESASRFEELREKSRKEFREDIAAGVAEGWRHQVVTKG